MRNLIRSFRYAFAGVLYCLRTQPNMRIHGLAAMFAAILAWRMGLSRVELVLLALAIAAVLVAEMFNTAIEAVVDLISPQFHPLAKIAKDVAAGAVLLTAIASLAVGYILFVYR